MKQRVIEKITTGDKTASLWQRRVCLIPMYAVTFDRKGIPQEPYPQMYYWSWSKGQALAIFEQARQFVNKQYDNLERTRLNYRPKAGEVAK